MRTEAIFLRFCKLRRPLGVLVILLLLGLCACSSAAPSPSPVPAAALESTPEAGPDSVLQGRWTCPVDIGGEVSAALGFDLSPWLSAPLLAELRLEIGREGGCSLTRDDRACGAALREALRACEEPFEKRIAEIKVEIENVSISEKEKLAAESDGSAALAPTSVASWGMERRAAWRALATSTAMASLTLLTL